MPASLWDQVWLPLLIGVAIQIIFTALYFLSVRLWKCLMKQIKTQTPGGESMTEPELELRIGNSGEGIDSFSDEETHTPVIKSPVTTPKAQVTRVAAREAPCACRNGRSSFAARGSKLMVLQECQLCTNEAPAQT